MEAHVPNSRSRAANTLFDLLTTIGNEITPEILSRLKILLRGHVDKEVLDHVQSGSALLHTLCKRGLVTEKRLAFLRKLLTETKSCRLVTYIDSYKDKHCTRPGSVDEGYLEMSRYRIGKERRLQSIIERIENELKCHENHETECTENIERLEKEISESKESMTTLEEEILKLKCNLKKEHQNRQSVEKRLGDVTYLVKNLSRDSESLMTRLEDTDKNKDIQLQDELIAKHAEIKGNQLHQGELLKKYEHIITNIRVYNETFRGQAGEMITIETKLQEDTTQLRNLKKRIVKNKASALQLRDTLFDVTQELEQLKYSETPLALYTSRGESAHSRVSTSGVRMAPIRTPRDSSAPEAGRSVPASPLQMIDYNGLTGAMTSVIIGRKGKKSDPPNFMFPCSVALDQDGNIYVADSRNRRVQILRMDGSLLRKPIEFGKFQPSAVAVSKNGKCFISDSYVVRAYSPQGDPLCHILPIYGKTDLRPTITSVAISNDEAVLIVDAANKRIQKFRQDGIFLNFVGGNHVFHSPYGVTVSRKGEVIVSELEEHQIKVFEGEHGPLKKQFGKKGLGYGKFWHPRGMTVDNNDNLIIADSGNHQIQVLSLNDDEEASFGGLGTTPGLFDTPCDVAVTSDGTRIVVVETRNHRVQVFERTLLHTDEKLVNTDFLKLQNTYHDKTDKDELT